MVCASEDLRVLIPNRLPADISWEQYLANQHRLDQNRSFHDVRGVPRRGDALLRDSSSAGNVIITWRRSIPGIRSHRITAVSNGVLVQMSRADESRRPRSTNW